MRIFSADNLDATILAQIISVGFIWFCSIVLMNLLVGLTIREIDLLRSNAWQISLKDKTLELIHDEKDCWGSGLPNISFGLPRFLLIDICL